MMDDKQALDAVSPPKEITTALTGRIEVDPNVWAVLHERAKDEKAWAESHEYSQNPDDWPASPMSIDMLKERLAKSVYEATVYLYSYLYYRAHLMGGAYSGHMDPAAARDWEKWSKEGLEHAKSINRP